MNVKSVVYDHCPPPESCLKFDRLKMLPEFLPQLRGICVPVHLDGMRTGRFDKVITLARRSHDHELAVLLTRELAAVNRKPLAALEVQLLELHHSHLSLGIC